MKIRRFFTFITCFALTGAVSDMTKDVKRGESVTLSAKTPNMRDVNRVTLWSRSENGTQVPIFRHCSTEEKQRGCTAINDDRLELQFGSENVSVIIINATDAGTRILEVIGNYMINETFTVVVFNESSGDTSITASPQSDFNTGTIGVVIAVIIIVVVTAVSIYLYKKKPQKKLDSCDRDRTVDSEELDTQSSIPGADELNTDAPEEHCLVEKKPEDPDSTHPDALHLINNNNDSNMNYNTNNNNDSKDVIIPINKCYMQV